MSEVLSFKLEIEKMIEICKDDKNDDLQKIIDSAKVIVSNAETLMNKFYSSNTKESLCFEFCVNLCMQQISLCDNLQ